ncbi:MAG: IS4 family transposase [Betaproteobacteria bacterium]|nr:IS4 family transposase [Betaproteobacteria bacterium]
MQTQAIVARMLNCCAPLMHSMRLRALRDVVLSAVGGKALSLTALALGTCRATSVRHRVKCVDRLLANRHLDEERFAVYRALAHQWLSGLPQLLIVVDWSSLTADMRWHWLRASVVVEGRSITLYEEVHARTHLAGWRVHQRFIEKLAALLPVAARPPIIVTDAGFRAPWFRLVAEQGWYWVGRTRNRDFVRRSGSEWFPAKHLYAQATATAKDLGAYEAVRNYPLICRFALFRKKPGGRQHKYPSGKVMNNSSTRKIAQRYREPWLLSYSPELAYLGAAVIVKLYARRMQIEQQFRDTKNLALGMGLAHAKSRSRPRLQALLLIAHIAQLAKRLIGEAAKAQQLALHLMSNNEKHRNTLSVMTLATRVIDRPDLLRKISDPWAHLQTLRRQATLAINHNRQGL